MAIFTVEFLLHWLAECWTGSGCCGSLIGILKDTECELNWELAVVVGWSQVNLRRDPTNTQC